MAQDEKYTKGCRKEGRDPRDCSAIGVGASIKEFKKKFKKPKSDGNSVDLASNGGVFAFIDIQNQGTLNSCTAHATIGLLQYFQQVTNPKGKLNPYERHDKFSRLFLYKTTRLLMEKKLPKEIRELEEKQNLSDTEQDLLAEMRLLLEEIQCDVGAGLRYALRAMNSFGVPLEDNFCYKQRLWEDYPCNEEGGWNEEPDHDIYKLALQYKGITYYSLIDDEVLEAEEERKEGGEVLLCKAEKSLRDGIPFAFGFDTYLGIGKGIDCGYGKKGCYPYGIGSDGVYRKYDGGHAVIAVGYDRGFKIDGYKGEGALRIRNSYGDGKDGRKNWGNNGYGWLSYDYIRKGFAKGAVDGFFCLIDTDF